MKAIGGTLCVCGHALREHDENGCNGRTLFDRCHCTGFRKEKNPFRKVR